MKEVGANEELYSLIVSSLEDWDAKMQIESATSFVEPLRLGLVSTINAEKTIMAAM